MNIKDILSKFQGVRQNGPGDWMAICPAHEDKNGSLHISEKPTGDVVMHCFAGCQTESVLRSVGLGFCDLPSSQTTFSRRYGLHLAEYSDAKRVPVEYLQSYGLKDGMHACKNGKTYPGVQIPYYAADGKFTRTRWRMCLKSDGTGPSRFLWDNNGGYMHLYGLWKQPSDRSSMILVEGESDCHALWMNGYNALGMPGVTNYKAYRDDPIILQYGSPDAPKVYVHLEPDCGGYDLFALLTGQNGKPASTALEQMLFFSIPGYKDPSDLWIACRDKADTIEAASAEFRAVMSNALANARRWNDYDRPAAWNAIAERKAKEAAEKQAKYDADAKKAKDSSTPQHGGAREGAGRKSADYIGAAKAFFEKKLVKGQTGLIFWRHGWWEYDGHSYQHKDDNDLEGEMLAYYREIGAEDEFHFQMTTNAIRNCALNLRAGGLCHLPQEMPAPSWIHDRSSARGWLPMRNCLVDLDTACRVHLQAEEEGSVISADLANTYCRKLTADLLATYAMDYDYDPSAKCINFLKWLEDVQPEKANRDCIQMLMGLALVPDTSYNVCFFLSGEGGTGKSTFLNILIEVVGRQNVCSVPLLKFGERFQTWPLAENLVNVVGELPTDDPQGRLRYIEGDFKDSCSGANVNCERKGKDVCTAPCIARHIFACNSLPKFFDKSEGIWDRLRIFPFTQRFRGTNKQIQNIERTFIPDELPGIFNFALVGLGKLKLLAQFPETDDMLTAKATHRNACDPEAEYINANYEPATGWNYFVDEAYTHFRNYLIENGLKLRSKNSLVTAMLREFGRKGVELCHVKDDSSDVRKPVFRNLRPLYLPHQGPAKEEETF